MDSLPLTDESTISRFHCTWVKLRMYEGFETDYTQLDLAILNIAAHNAGSAVVSFRSEAYNVMKN